MKLEYWIRLDLNANSFKIQKIRTSLSLAKRSIVAFPITICYNNWGAGTLTWLHG